MDLLKKTVIVTGANRGTGRVIAENFIAHGAEVFIHSINEGDSQSAAKEMGFGVPLWEISLATRVRSKSCLSFKKGTKLSILVNNLGSRVQENGAT